MTDFYSWGSIFLIFNKKNLKKDSSQMRPTWEELIEDFRQWNRYDDWFITLEQYDQTNGHNGQVGALGKYWYEDAHVSKLTDR